MNTDNKSPEPLANLSDIDQAILMGASGSVSSEQVAVPAVVEPGPSKSVAFDVMWRALMRISLHRPYDAKEGFIAEDAEHMRDIAKDAMKAVMKSIANDLNAAVLPSNTGDQP